MIKEFIFVSVKQVYLGKMDTVGCLIIPCVLTILSGAESLTPSIYQSFGDFYNDYIPDSGLMSGRDITLQIVTSSAKCAMLCAGQPLCVSFDITRLSPSSLECVTRNNLITNVNFLTQYKSNSKYYHKGVQLY